MILKSKSKGKASLRFLLVALLFYSFIILSCAQDSIFFDISHEPEPRSPLITGTPTNMVLVRNELFVGSRMSNKIFRFGGAGGSPEWSSIQQIGGSLGDLASDGQYLYALVFPDGNPLSSSVIRRFNTAQNVWDEEYSMAAFSIQTIHGAGGRLFAGAMLRADRQNFAILYLAPASSSLTVIKNNTFLLTGAVSAGGGTFLSTAGAGIFRYSGGSVETRPVSGTEDANIAGIIETERSVVAVSSNGTIYSLTTQGIFSSFSTRLTFTGALSTWGSRENNWRPSLLLAGIRGRGTSRVNGYREIVLDMNGLATNIIRTPGDDSHSSVRHRARYTASIGLHPVEAIMQLPDAARGGPLNYSAFLSDPDWEPPIFATTSRNGLWSYRNRSWNAEE